jgi:hypothetical protein
LVTCSSSRSFARRGPCATATRASQLRDRYVVDIGGDHEKRVDRRLVIALAIGLDAFQNR